MNEPVVLMKSLVGSRLYNLHTDASDYDYRYVQISPLLHALSPFRNLDTKSKVDGKEDDTVWEFRMFAKYAANGNPSVYEALFSDDVLWGPEIDAQVRGRRNPHLLPLLGDLVNLGEEMVENRLKFLDARRVFDAHRSYATAQLKKMNWEDTGMRHRKAIVAYLRVLDQGAKLLYAPRYFNPRLETGTLFHEFLMEIKEDYKPSMRERIEHFMKEGEKEIQAAFEKTTIAHADHDYIEDLIKRVYLVQA